jgi:Ca-activated chloride channel homolog
MSDNDTATATGAASAPPPTVTLTTLKPALPAEGGVVDALLHVDVPFPETDRPPIAVSLVIDRSGSMSGEPLEAAKRAAAEAVDMLMPGDWVAIIAFDHLVEVRVPLLAVGSDRRGIVKAIDRITSGGNTALHAGWVEGLTQALACSDVRAVKRVVLLSDGCANVGVDDAPSIARDVAESVTHGVSTSAFGFGRHYDEALLRAVADAGRGNYVFIEDATQVADAFTGELAGVSGLRGRSARLRSVAEGVRIRHAARDLRADAHGLVLPDLVAGLPIDHLVELEIDAGTTTVELALTWDDVVLREAGEERIRLELPALVRSEYAKAPASEAVRLARALLEIADAKEKIMLAARRWDHGAAMERLTVLGGLVAMLPAGADRRREEQELARLRMMIERQEFDLASRYAEKQAMGHKRSRKDHMLNSMMASEFAYRQQRAAAREQQDLFGTFESGPGTDQASDVAGRLVAETVIQGPTGRSVRIQLVHGDLTEQRVDAIVNSTNRGLFGTMGVDGAIHRKGGPALTAAAKAIGKLDYGEAAFTKGFRLPASFVIHTATPPWKGTGKELDVLRRCYVESLGVAERLGVQTLAFPAIGTGTYAYPLEDAAAVAVQTVLSWAAGRGTVGVVRFVVLDEANLVAYGRVLHGVGAPAR